MNIESEEKRRFRDWEKVPMCKVQYGNEYSTPWNYYTDDFEDAVKTARVCVAELNYDYAEVLKKDETPGNYVTIERFSLGDVNRLKFVLNGCDISFIAEAPEDITLKQLLKQCDKIKPHWCACGICSLSYDGFINPVEDVSVDIMIGYDTIEKCNDDVCCDIMEV